MTDAPSQPQPLDRKLNTRLKSKDWNFHSHWASEISWLHVNNAMGPDTHIEIVIQFREVNHNPRILCGGSSKNDQGVFLTGPVIRKRRSGRNESQDQRQPDSLADASAI